MKKEERGIFWKGLLMGIIGGLFANLTVSAFFEWINDFWSINKITLFFIFGLLFVAVLLWIMGKISDNEVKKRK